MYGAHLCIVHHLHHLHYQATCDMYFLALLSFAGAQPST